MHPGIPTAAALAASSSSPSNIENDAALQQELMLLGLRTGSNPSATSSYDTVSLIGPQVLAQIIGTYAGLKNNGTFSSETAYAAGAKIASHMKAALVYHTYAPADIRTDSDTSAARVSLYQKEFQTAVSPLQKNEHAESYLFRMYYETGDPSYRDELLRAAANYRAAAENAAKIKVPADALNYHVAVLNSLQNFAATINAMATHTEDPFTVATLAGTYKDSTMNMFSAFETIGNYFRDKHV